MALTDGLIEYWKLDGNSNGIFGNNGTDTSITYNSGNGKLIQGAGFNGTASNISITHSSSFNTNNIISASAWCYPTTNTRYEPILTKYSLLDSTKGWEMSNNAGTPRCILRGSLLNVTGSSGFTLNAWNHIAFTYNGTTLTLYLNGVSVGTNTGSSTTDSSVNIRIGTRNDGNATDWFTGNIDECCFWNRALSADEVKDLYLNGNGSQYPFRDKGFLMM